MGYLLAWFVAIACTLILSGLVWWALKKWPLVALWVIALGSFWALCPWKYDGENYAPLFIVVLFTGFLEPGKNPATPAAFGFLISMAICLVIVGYVLFAGARKLKRKAKNNVF